MFEICLLKVKKGTQKNIFKRFGADAAESELFSDLPV